MRVTAHAYELAALVAAARFVIESAPPDIPEQALEQLRQLLSDYDTQTARSGDT